MRQKGFIFEVGQLIHAGQGTSYKFELDDPVTFEIAEESWVEPEITSNVKGFASFMKVDGGILVTIDDLHLKMNLKCTKCTKQFSYEITSEPVSRVFVFERTKQDSDIFDEYYVDMKSFSIDITDFLRQEIILHFPMIPVCSSSCEGLCPLCGKDLNEGKCLCKANSLADNNTQTHKPLSILKDLYKE
ncbi:DUF177 domain-containing protein [Patescibacteria group bacterium]|nr:DUF177 domain-containing protein [Patescibacteria group bacterium]